METTTPQTPTTAQQTEKRVATILACYSWMDKTEAALLDFIRTRVALSASDVCIIEVDTRTSDAKEKAKYSSILRFAAEGLIRIESQGPTSNRQNLRALYIADALVVG